MASPNVTGEGIIVYRKDDDYGAKYSIRFNIQKNGAWLNDYMQLQLPMNCNLPDKAKINIRKGYITFYPTKNGNKFKIVVLDYDMLDSTPIGNIELTSDNAMDDDFLW